MIRKDAFAAGFSASLGVAALALALFLGYQLLQAAVAISTPFVAAFVVSLLLDPVVDRVQNQVRLVRGKRLPAVALVFFLFLLSFATLILLVVPSLIEQTQKLVQWFAPSTGDSGFDDMRRHIDRWLDSHRQIGPLALPPSLDALTTQYSDQVSSALKAYAGRVAGVIVGSISGLLSVILIPIVTFYLLLDMDHLRARMLYLLPGSIRSGVAHAARDVGGVFSNYIRGMMQVCLAYAVTACLAMGLVSVWFAPLRSYALLVGIVAGLLYAVPYVGFFGAAALAGTVALVSGSGVAALAIAVLTLFCLNQIFDNIITPRVVGGGIGLHPILSMVALLLGASLFGLWGMLLSVPAAGSIQVVLFRLFPKLTAPTPLGVFDRRLHAPAADAAVTTPPEDGA